MARHATALEAVRVAVPEAALEAYEAAIGEVCATVGFFLDEASGLWTVEGVRATGDAEDRLAGALALAGIATGFEARPIREAVPADGWLARSFSGFPAQRVGRVSIRGTHLPPAHAAGGVELVLDAAAAFGSGEHATTRGCLRAMQRPALGRPGRILDLGTGTGVLAMAAALLWHRPALATDIDPWAVRTAADNVRLNRLRGRVRVLRADGWRTPALGRGGPYDLVMANILARPLIGMAGGLAGHLAPGGRAILSGLLRRQMRWVLAAHRARGLVLEAVCGPADRAEAGAASGDESGWATLVLRKRR